MSSGLNTKIYGVGTNTSRGVGTGDSASMNTSGGILDRACGGNIPISMCHARPGLETSELVARDV